MEREIQQLVEMVCFNMYDIGRTHSKLLFRALLLLKPGQHLLDTRM
jgi:hypothetical protein